jgi:hypothetical protein
MKKGTKKILLIGGVIIGLLWLFGGKKAAAEGKANNDSAGPAPQKTAGQTPHTADPFGQVNPAVDLQHEAWMTSEYAKLSSEGPRHIDGPGGEKPTSAQLDFMGQRL